MQEAVTEHQVVVNEEGQYSIWFADKTPPSGWKAEGTRGTKEKCLEHVAAVWTDMRPRSVRESV